METRESRMQGRERIDNGIRKKCIHRRKKIDRYIKREILISLCEILNIRKELSYSREV